MILLGRISFGGITPFNAHQLPIGVYLMYADAADELAASGV